MASKLLASRLPQPIRGRTSRAGGVFVPVNLNTAPRELLLRVPGLGTKAAQVERLQEASEADSSRRAASLARASAPRPAA